MWWVFPGSSCSRDLWHGFSDESSSFSHLVRRYSSTAVARSFTAADTYRDFVHS